MARRRNPSDEYLEALLREALRLYALAIPTATPMQCMTWLSDRRLFVESAWPFDADRRTVEIIDRAMHHVVHSKLHPSDALADARIEMRYVRPRRRPLIVPLLRERTCV